MTPGKRCFDLVLVLVLLVPLGAVMLIIAVVLLALQGRPVFFASVRMRSPARSFRLWKFRTMLPGPETVTAGHSASRVTRCGGILRRVRLDELPHLWNILRGDMSFVGPRPPLRAVVAACPDIYARVLASRPGVTGLASLVFHRHEAHILARCGTPGAAEDTYLRRCVARKARIDLIYQARRSTGLDLVLIARTLAVPIGGIGGILRARRTAPRGIRRKEQKSNVWRDPVNQKSRRIA